MAPLTFCGCHIPSGGGAGEWSDGQGGLGVEEGATDLGGDEFTPEAEDWSWWNREDSNDGGDDGGGMFGDGGDDEGGGFFGGLSDIFSSD